MNKESIGNVFRIVLGVSLFCSVLVAGSAVVLRDKQNANKSLDRKKNVLIAAGIYKKGMGEQEILEKFSMIKPLLLDFKSGNLIEDMDPSEYDMEKSSKDPDLSISIPKEKDYANIRKISPLGVMYLYLLNNELEKIIIPISGPGLWSTVYGFLSLEKDGKTISGINFYEHGETPGLGGEIDNPLWQSNWTGKILYGEDGSPKIEVVKGSVDSSRDGSQYKVDGISGATITGRAVGDFVRFWVSDFAYGKILKSPNYKYVIEENKTIKESSLERKGGKNE